MARKLKPYKVDSMRNDKTGITVDIMLDRNTQVFFGMVGPMRIEDETAEKCKTKVYVALQDYTGLQWAPFIVIEHAGGTGRYWSSDPEDWDGEDENADCTEADAKLNFNRLLGAQTGDDAWVQRPFEQDAPGGSYHFKDEHYMDRWYRRDGDDEVVIPYTEEAWKTLCTMAERIDEIAKFLVQFARRADLVKMLNNPKGDVLQLTGNQK